MKNVLLVLFVVLLSTAVFAQDMVNVHFIVNTSGIPDTLGKTSTVQLRGSRAPLTWNGGSGVFLKNSGSDDEWGSSDYWYGTAQFPRDSLTYFKIYTNAHDSVWIDAEWEHQGWEGNVSAESNDRILDLDGFTGTDTTLMVQYANGWADKPGQYAAPWDSYGNESDTTFTVYLRVNMQGFEAFNPEQHVVGVRGSNTLDWGQTGEMSWGTTYLLSVEPDHTNGGSRQYPAKNFYSAPVTVHNKYKDSGLKWKFVVHYKGNDLSEDWGDMMWNPSLEEEISFTGSGNDTTVYWRWYDRFEPVAKVNEDTVVVTYEADMTAAINKNGFTPGDSVVVRRGWNSTATDIISTKPMIKQGLIGNIYAVTDTVITTIGDDLQYNYYIVKEGTEYREVFYDFTDPSSSGTSSEKRKVNVTGKVMTVEDKSTESSDLRRQPLFRNLENISQAVTVYYTVDLRPAYYTVKSGKALNDIQGILHVTEADSVFTWGVAINGPATGGWGTWGAGLMADTARAMHDDGLEGDEVAGDSIYTLAIEYDTDDVVGQEFKFGIGGGDNEGGEGGFGNNHVENIDDSETSFYLRSQIGSINPLYYDAWDYDKQEPTAIANRTQNLPKAYKLEQNYPNPFNPVTRISYQLPKAGKVSLVIYNVLGQKVRTLFEGNANAGTHYHVWRGTDNLGNKVATGVYFYKLEANGFTSIKKMVLVK